MTGLASDTVLVTGGAGFIGAHLVGALDDLGARVVVLDDLSGGDAGSLPPGVELIVADVSDPEVIELVAGVRAARVFHMAAQVSVARSMADPERDRMVNLIGTAHVVEGARRSGAQRIVYVSSGGAIYGDAVNVDESALPEPSSYYGIHKYAAERYVGLSGLPHAIARLSNVYGPGQRADLEGGVVAIFSRCLAAGEPVTIYGSGTQSRDFIAVADVVDALLSMMENAASDTWNVSSGTETTIIELLEEFERLLGIKAVVEWQPARAGEVKRSSLVSGRLERDLGWRPRLSLREGLRDVLAASAVPPA